MKEFRPKRYIYKTYIINYCFCGYEKPMYLILSNLDKWVHTASTLKEAKEYINSL